MLTSDPRIPPLVYLSPDRGYARTGSFLAYMHRAGLPRLTLQRRPGGGQTWELGDAAPTFRIIVGPGTRIDVVMPLHGFPNLALEDIGQQTPGGWADTAVSIGCAVMLLGPYPELAEGRVPFAQTLEQLARQQVLAGRVPAVPCPV